MRGAIVVPRGGAGRVAASAAAAASVDEIAAIVVTLDALERRSARPTRDAPDGDGANSPWRHAGRVYDGYDTAMAGRRP